MMTNEQLAKELTEDIDQLTEELRYIDSLIAREMFKQEESDKELARLDVRALEIEISLEDAKTELADVLNFDVEGC